MDMDTMTDIGGVNHIIRSLNSLWCELFRYTSEELGNCEVKYSRVLTHWQIRD